MLQPKKFLYIVNFVLLFILLSMSILNQAVLAQNKEMMGMHAGNFLNRLTSIRLGGGDAKLTGDLAQDAASLAISRGIPQVYGQELIVSFDDVQKSMDIMKQFDPTYGNKKIVLAGEDLKRYIDIGMRIACEYCCGAKALVSKDGEAACGCAHSQAMRGLAAYLIQNHAKEYSNDQILRELARWKGRYFPKQMTKKVGEQMQSGQFTTDVASLLLDLKLPKYSTASQDVPLPSDIKDAPGMVGGC